MTKLSKWGYLPDLADWRDFKYANTHKKFKLVLPSHVDLSSKVTTILDQGAEGSCTANSLAYAYAATHNGFAASRSLLYYLERAIEGDIGTDGGAMLRDGIKALNKTGAALEVDWPYTKAYFKKKPTAKILKEAGLHKITSYSRLSTGNDMRNCLANGHPFVAGITVYESFESAAVAKTGIIPMPEKGEKAIGGHALAFFSYDPTTYGGPNSWSKSWGNKGFLTIPREYLENPDLCSDIWTIRA